MSVPCQHDTLWSVCTVPRAVHTGAQAAAASSRQATASGAVPCIQLG
jgi:hypothetical protein